MKKTITMLALAGALLAGCNPCADEAAFVANVEAPKSPVDAPAAQTPAPAESTAPAEPPAEPGIEVCAQSTAYCGPSPYPLPPGRLPRTSEPSAPCVGAACQPTFGPVTY